MELDFPSDILEKLLLKRVLVDKNWLNILSKKFDKRWFKNDTVSLIVKLTLNYYGKYSSIPNAKIIQMLAQKYAEKVPDSNVKASDVQQLLGEVQSLDYNIPDNVLSQNLKEFIKRNSFYNALYDNSELLSRNPESYEAVVSKCLENFEEVQKIIFNDTDLGMNYFSEKDQASHWEYIKNPEAKIKTNWTSIDEYTNGGFLKDGKMLALFMAQAGLGKSVFLSNLAVNFLKQNLSVVVISLEMSENVYASRFDAHISNSDINKLKDNEETALTRIQSFYKQHPKANLYIKEYPPRSVKSMDIQCYLENLKNADKHFDVVIIDYLNLVLPNHKTDSMYKDGLAVSEELRALSYQFGCPFVSAVQANTEGMNTESIDMQNVSESRGIVHTVDFLAALYQCDDDRENGIINMRLLKNRLGGRIGKISNFTLDPETLVVQDITFDKSYIMDEVQCDDSKIDKLSSQLSTLTSDIDIEGL